MDSSHLKQYLTYAILMIRANTIVLWMLACIGLLSSMVLLFRDASFYWPLNVLTIAISISITPVFYGIYVQLIEDRYSSIGTIARTYVLNYIWLLIRMYVPAVFVASLPLLVIPAERAGGYLEITLIFFSLLYIYVIPVYYVTGRQYGAISGGIGFLFTNLAASAPILLAVLLLEAGMLILQQGRAALAGATSAGFVLLDFLVYMSASIIDLAIFIILIFILKNHGEGGPEREE
jgi:hypothetical protein